ncbi:MAG: acyl-CoA synthetase [candidate division KSB1 bacterium]|nr:acyl-CoA synthetase [candidate division KSB1 bacterium]MDZ7273404.1 acyl-CoA synthetase [candidate division KSB1 bacterium]MDZ7287003.1 acyl-CoA synthetase [candidate division KSB1 bacterium]MDZ7299644.1 acyl-CoA synthetase [candidate division KSB1 bacterium]MDZ7307206.1 acyl-CoA synthetase [candidate division KSB1 bacterium]
MQDSASLPLFAAAGRQPGRLALVTTEGRFSHGDLLSLSAGAATVLLNGSSDFAETRVALLAPPSLHFVAALLGIWRAGGIAVPLAATHPPAELEYVLHDCGAEVLVVHPELAARLPPLTSFPRLRLVYTSELQPAVAAALPGITAGRRGLIIYTSGTTSKPKGVVLTHGNLAAQVSALLTAWEWSPDDYILNVLPLHHVHGLINVLTCALWAGATCELMPVFEAGRVWQRFMSGCVTLFMAVPTIYSKLIAAWEAAPPHQQQAMSAACAKLRLMVSGSAALPVAVLEKWQALSGHVLLERYGMTEIGMALSNPLHGRRRPGCVGTPLPGVTVRLVDENGRAVAAGTPGEIQVKGANVFREYWGKPEATQQAFREGWFCTGDLAVFEDGAYRILGRLTTDIIKTGGYKVAALEIEEVLRQHPAVADCSIVGLPDAVWGERVAALLMLRPGAALNAAELRHWAAAYLAPYKIPTLVQFAPELPRNAMGKVIKAEVTRMLQAECKEESQ